MSFATVATVIGAGTSLYSAYWGSRGNSGASANPEQLAALADPFGPHREGWAQRLEEMWSSLSTMNPQEIMKDPQFAFLKEQGLGALNSSMAAKGMYSSGNRGVEGARFAEGLSTSFLDKRWQQQQQLLGNLLTASGATSGAPGAAAQAYGSQYAANESRVTGGIGNALGLLSRYSQPNNQSSTAPTWGYNGSDGLT